MPLYDVLYIGISQHSVVFCIITCLSDRRHLLNTSATCFSLEALGIKHVIKALCQITTDVNELTRQNDLYW